MSHPDFDILIVGGGVVGLTLAALLGNSPLTIAILDQQPISAWVLKESYDLRVSAINLASQAIFESLNLWQTIENLRLSSYQKMHVWDAGSPAKITFAAHEIKQPYLGHIVEHSVLRQVL